MTDLAALADEIERLNGERLRLGNIGTRTRRAFAVADFVADNLPAILTALRASRPEPAADDEDDYEPFDPGNPKLKRCPFCGGEAGLFEIDDMTDANCGGHYVACKTCEASTNLRFSAGDDARPLVCEQWNSRHQRSAPEPAADAVEAVARALLACDHDGSLQTAEQLWAGSSEAVRNLHVGRARAALSALPRPSDVVVTDEMVDAAIDRWAGFREWRDTVCAGSRRLEMRAAIEAALTVACPAVPDCCPVCGGDCGSANPPVLYCPMRPERGATLPRPADEGATPCGREGCGHTMACCRPDCPIELLHPEAGMWTWRRKAAAQEGSKT